MMMMMMGGGGMEEVMCEVSREEVNEQGLPPGFRFHPTDEELITFYLASKVFNGSFSGVDIAEVDLNRCEPWDLPDMAKMGEREWYFFSLRDRKYPTGLRTNRATGAGYWKATGKDREVHSASTGALLGMKKTLVFYKGRAPRGQKTKWVMHEYRLDGDFSYRHTCKEEWVICRIFHKTGEKKNPMFLGGGGEHLGGYHHSGGGGGIRAAVVGSASLPALLDAQTSTLLFEAQSHHHHHHPTLLMQAPATVSNPNPNPFLEHGQERNEQLLKALIVSHSSSSPALAFPVHNNNNNSSGFQSSCTSSSFFSTTTTPSATDSNKINGGSNNNTSTSASTSTSVLFKSLLSHQECSFKQEQTSSTTPIAVPKQCKTEANFSHFQLPDANMHWVDRMHSSNLLHHHHHHHHHQNPLFFEMDYDDGGGVFGGDAAAAAAATAANTTTTTTTAAVHDMSTSSIAFNRAGFQMMLDFPIRLPGGESWPLDP